MIGLKAHMIFANGWETIINTDNTYSSHLILTKWIFSSSHLRGVETEGE